MMSFPNANFSHFQMPIANCQFPIADFSLFPLLSESTELAKIVNRQCFRQSARLSLIAQRNQRIEFRRSSRRDITSHQSDYSQQNSDGHKSNRIFGRYAKK